MTNRPLIMKMISSLKGWNLIARATTNKDWENPELCKLEDVQSAKRLLKAQLQDRLYPADADDIVDACFQIDDGDDDE